MKSKAFLFRDFSDESDLAEKKLKEADIDFVSVFADSKRKLPFLDADISAFSFTGIGEIKRFVDSIE